MLPKLFLRDWILNRRVILFSFGIFGAFQLYSVTAVSSARVWLVFASIYAAFLAVTLFVREDKFGATGWSCTLPVTRREIVQARFLESWAMVLTALGAATLLAVVMPGSAFVPAELFQTSTLLIGATIVTLVLSLMQPFTIRFGFLGVMIFLIGAQLLGVILLTGLMALRRSGVLGGGESGRPIVDAIAPIGTALAALRETLSPTPFALLVVAVLVLTNWLGYRLAVALFRRREL